MGVVLVPASPEDTLPLLFVTFAVTLSSAAAYVNSAIVASPSLMVVVPAKEPATAFYYHPAEESLPRNRNSIFRLQYREQLSQLPPLKAVHKFQCSA